MSNPLPRWILERAEDTAAATGMPMGAAIEFELSVCEMYYGLPLPPTDPGRNPAARRQRPTPDPVRVLDAERFVA